MTTAAEALARLMQGNETFVAAARDSAPLPFPELRPEKMAAAQEPFAAILGCADSRVTPEFIFQQGIGDLFVVRVAGDVPAAACRESLEFAVAHLGVPLVVVLGHSECGAVKATLAELDAPREGGPALPDTMGLLKPQLEKLRAARPDLDGDELVDMAVHVDVAATLKRLLVDSEVLATAVDAGKARLVGAVYDMATGAVSFTGAGGS